MADEDKLAGGNAWGDDISSERKVELEARLQAWANEVDHGKKRGPFDGVELTGADVSWLAARSLAESDDEAVITSAKAGVDGKAILPTAASELHLEGARLGGAHLEGASLKEAHLERADLGGAHLEGARLDGAYLERAHLWHAHLEGAHLWHAHLEGTSLREAHLEGASLRGAQLEGADLWQAHLEGASLGGAHLEGAYLRQTHLEGADLWQAHLEGTYLNAAHLEGRRFEEDDAELKRIRQWASDFPAVLPPADLRLASFDRATQLTGATLGNADLGYVRVADTDWGDANLAVVDWGDSPVLLDERAAREWKPAKLDANGKHLTPEERREAQREQRPEQLRLFREATRANRQLATALRDQGLSDDADKFAYRAQVLQRTVLRLRGRRGTAAGSWLLDLVSGYGYQPMRSVFTYAFVVLAFAVAYFVLGGSHGALSWNEALVVSMTAFHGRGFFGSAFQPGDPQAAVAAVEALVGLLIEIVFIATFTQRFFGK